MVVRRGDRRQARQERRSTAWRVFLYLLLLGTVVMFMLRLRPARRPAALPGAAPQRATAARGEKGSAAAATGSAAPATMPTTAGNASGVGPATR